MKWVGTSLPKINQAEGGFQRDRLCQDGHARASMCFVQLINEKTSISSEVRRTTLRYGLERKRRQTQRPAVPEPFHHEKVIRFHGTHPFPSRPAPRVASHLCQ